jgi:hypothetical protein
MFSVALVFWGLGTQDLLTARVVSVLVGVLTLVGVYVYGRRRFSPAAGLLAAAGLAASPFWLSFARVAFTETDVYLACTVIWLLIAVDQLHSAPAVGRAAIVGVLLGLSLAAKATAFSLLPVVWYALRSGPHNPLENGKKPISTWMMIAVGCVIGVWITASLYMRTAVSPAASYRLLLVGWLAVLGWAVIDRQRPASRLGLAIFLTPLALFTFFVLPPEHFANPGILQALFTRAEHEMQWNLAFSAEAAGLHLLSIVFKSSPILGAALLIGPLAAGLQAKKRPELRVPLLAAGGYFGGLLLLPLAQTFYTIPILPVITLLAADQFLRLAQSVRKLARGAALAAALLAGMLLAADLVQCYPDYNLNGYQWLGARALAGRASVGYRSVVQTPSDGVEQAFLWLNENAKPGQVVRTYLLPWHIVQATAPNPSYTIVNGFSKEIMPNPDYVVVEINTMIRQSWWTDATQGELFTAPYDPIWLAQNYSLAYAVDRRFGIQMASVWEKNQAPSSPKIE